jgi:hypothetical protein
VEREKAITPYKQKQKQCARTILPAPDRNFFTRPVFTYLGHCSSYTYRRECEPAFTRDNASRKLEEGNRLWFGSSRECRGEWRCK